jgi:outer membrane protein assembly factor BamB
MAIAILEVGRRRSFLATIVGVTLFISGVSRAQEALAWPRFRGPNGQGMAEGAKPPVEFGPGKNVLWKTELPPGVSSPVVAGDRIFLTGFEKGRLLTHCVDRKDGKILWRREAPTDSIEKVHQFSSPASATPVTDGKRVYVYFGSYGLLAYEADGAEAWKLPLEKPKTDWGTASSPMIVGDLVIQLRDTDGRDSFLLAVERATGKVAWKKPRPLAGAAWSTPVIWSHESVDDLLVMGTGRLVAYSAKDGTEHWSAVGFPVNTIMSVALGDGLAFGGASGSGDPGDRVGQIPDFATMLKLYDKNHDGRLSPDEIPPDAGFYLRKEVPKEAAGNFISLRLLIKETTGGKPSIGALDWKLLELGFNATGPAFAAIRPGGQSEHDDLTDTNVAWKTSHNIPEIPTPLYYAGRLYMVRDGGRVACLAPKTGDVIFHDRVDAPGQYVASPVAADGRIYLTSEPGTVTVIKAGEKFEVLASNAINERILATPAILGDAIYVRTENHLYAFSSAADH